jgi:hypothetical protein
MQSMAWSGPRRVDALSGGRGTSNLWSLLPRDGERQRIFPPEAGRSAIDHGDEIRSCFIAKASLSALKTCKDARQEAKPSHRCSWGRLLTSRRTKREAGSSVAFWPGNFAARTYRHLRTALLNPRGSSRGVRQGTE